MHMHIGHLKNHEKFFVPYRPNLFEAYASSLNVLFGICTLGIPLKRSVHTEQKLYYSKFPRIL